MRHAAALFGLSRHRTVPWTKVACLTLAFALATGLCGSAAACPSDYDSTFADGGVLAPDGAGGFGDSAAAADGGLLIASGAHIQKYGRSGELDPSFGDAGVASVAGDAPDGFAFYDITVGADGSIVGVGMAGSYHFVIARFDADGKPDLTFGTKGIAIFYYGWEMHVSRVIVRSDAAVLVVGNAYVGSTGLGATAWLFRYDGVFVRWAYIGARLGIVPYSSWGIGAVEVADKAFLIAGSAPYKTGVFLARIDHHGLIDPTYGEYGIRVIPPLADVVAPYTEWTEGIARDGEGRVYVASESGELSHRRIRVRRFLADGRIDRSYGRHGVARLRLARGFYSSDFAVTADGYSTIVSQFARLTRGSFVARFAPDGSRDRTFGKLGIVRFRGASSPQLESLALFADGGIAVTGERLVPDAGYAPMAVRIIGGEWDGQEQCIAGCGDGHLAAGEECDDGNAVNGDGCSAGCLAE